MVFVQENKQQDKNVSFVKWGGGGGGGGGGRGRGISQAYPVLLIVLF